MANSFVLAKNYVNNLDEVYKMASVTSDLMGDQTMVRAGASANEIIYPHISTSGLGDYSREKGYPQGAVSVEWKTAKFNYDRGTKITVDVMDDQETFNLAFGKAGAALQREKVAPEADAFTFATLAGKAGILKATPADLDSAEAFLAALIVAKNELDEAEVPDEERYLFATPTLVNSLLSLDTTKSKEAYNSFAVVRKVPKSRFMTAIELLDGKTTGEELGHYVPASDATYINFMIVHKPAIIKYDKHVANDLIPPSMNPDYDGYILKYRKYGIVDVYANKVQGIYLHASETSVIVETIPDEGEGGGEGGA